MFEKELPVQRCILRMSRNAKKDIYGYGEFSRWLSILFGTELKSPVLFEENGLIVRGGYHSGAENRFFSRPKRQSAPGESHCPEGKRVLNVFSYSGAFSVYAFAGGAKSVTEIDSNPHALKDSKKNLQQNFPEMPMHSAKFRTITWGWF